MVDVVLPTRSGQVIRNRCISQPTEHRQILLQRLGLKLPSALERAAMEWKLADASIESKDSILPTAELGLGPEDYTDYPVLA